MSATSTVAMWGVKMGSLTNPCPTHSLTGRKPTMRHKHIVAARSPRLGKASKTVSKAWESRVSTPSGKEEDIGPGFVVPSSGGGGNHATVASTDADTDSKMHYPESGSIYGRIPEWFGNSDVVGSSAAPSSGCHRYGTLERFVQPKAPYKAPRLRTDPEGATKAA